MDEFNTETETVTHTLWLLGQEINHDGECVNVDTPYSVFARAPLHAETKMSEEDK